MATQIDADRLLRLRAPISDSALYLVEMHGHEAMSELFSYELTFTSENLSLQPDEIVGKPISFSLRRADGSDRPFHGWVSRITGGDEAEDYRIYRLEVVPWLWLLTQSSDCRIFQRKPIDKILEEVFGSLGFQDFEFQLQLEHPEHEYCVQYRETDFDFATRLMAQEGIFYYFRHDADRHVMVIADHAGAYFDLSAPDVDYPLDRGTQDINDQIKSWEHGYHCHSGRWSHTDYDFENPSTSLMNSTRSVVKLPGIENLERYDYPGYYVNKNFGQSLADLRIAAHEAGHDLVHGTSTCRAFAVGGRFKVRMHRCRNEEGRQYVITAIEHHARSANPYESGDSFSFDYHNRFRCIPQTVPCRPDRKVVQPIVHGVQTAIVVGPPGEEIYTDKYGRVKVQFHWDRQGKKNDDSSCWVRVSQSHAGKGFGAIDTPRVGEEVIVSFLEGDPNRPIITGRVYHAQNMPPYPLPSKKVVSGIKSKTYKGDGYNELIMDDTAGDELIRIHAQHDMDTTVRNDVRESIGRDETVTINRDRTETIRRRHCQKILAEKDVWIGGGYNTQVFAEMNEFVVISRSEETLGFKTEYVGAHSYEEIRRTKKVQIGKNYTIEVGGNSSETVTGEKIATIKKSLTEFVDDDHCEVVKHKYHVHAETIELTATKKILLKVGNTVLTLDPSLLTGDSSKTEWLGGFIKLDSRGDIDIGATDKLDMNSLEFKLQAGSDGEIRGSVVKINC